MGVAFPSAWRILQISLMFSRCWGSLCQQPSMTSYTSLGQTRGRSKTRPWVMHSMTWKSENGEVTSEAQPENVVHRQQKAATSLSGSGWSRDPPGRRRKAGQPTAPSSPSALCRPPTAALGPLPVGQAVRGSHTLPVTSVFLSRLDSHLGDCTAFICHLALGLGI